MKVFNARKTLITSMIAIVISFAILIGYTFAWFTDSSVTGINKIQSGNLDVVLMYTNPSNGRSEEVGSNTQVFTDINGDQILWEPGASASGIFEVKNDGMLALKYTLNILQANATKTYSGKTLADVLTISARVNDKFTGTDNVMADRNLEALQVGDYLTDYSVTSNHILKDGFNTEGYLLPGESITYELNVIWNHSENDNEYNVPGGLSLDFAVALAATQVSYENDGEGSFYDSNANYPNLPTIPDSSLDDSWYEDGGKYLEILAGSFKMMDDPNTTIKIENDEIVLSYNGEVQGVLTSDNVSVEGNVVTISGTNDFDGVYTICKDGYIEKDGEIVAKSEKTWLDVEAKVYFIIHDGKVYLSLDGNTIYKEDGVTAEPLVELNELGGLVNSFLEGRDIQAWNDTYGYLFDEYDGENFTAGNLFDFLAVQNIMDKGEFYFGIYNGRYDYWGGAAKDVKTNDEHQAHINWATTDLDAVATTSVYLITKDGKKKLTTTDVADGGTFEIVQEIKYYHNGEETNNVMFFEDYALYFEDGMTYREWMHEYFVMEMHDICNGMHDHNGVYIPEEYLDKLCEPGYRSELQSPPDRLYSDYFGYYYSNGMVWTQELIFYSYGKTYIRPTNFNDDGYEYVGMAWEGGLQTDGTIYADEYYNYFLRNGKKPEVVPFYAAFKPENDNAVDISDYVTMNSYNQVVVDVEGLKLEYGIDANTNVIPVFEKDGYFVDCRDVNCIYNETTGGNYYEAYKVTLSYKTFNNGATGITLYYNGVVYTGFAK